MNIHIHTTDVELTSLIVDLITRRGHEGTTIVIEMDGDRRSKVVARATRLETGPRLVEAVMSEEDRQRRQMALERYIQAQKDYDDIIIGWGCSLCGATKSEPCHTAHGREMKRPSVHAIRRRDWMFGGQPVLVDPQPKRRPARKVSPDTSTNHPEWMAKPVTLDEM